MKTRTLSTALAGIISFLAVAVSAQVTVSTVATNGLNEPYNVVVDAQDNFYVSDSANNRIVRFDASTQAASTSAGIPGEVAGSNDGPPYMAHFNNPQGLLTVSIGGVSGLLVADAGNNLIRFVRFSDGVVTTLAGQTNAGPAVNATGASATFRSPTGLDQDSNGNVYIADWGNDTIRVMNLNDPAFGVTNVVISGTSLHRPTAVAFAGPNQLWVADTGNQMIKLITLATPTIGSLATSMGGYRLAGTTDSPFGPNARFNSPSGLLWVSGIGLFISDTLNNSLRFATNNPAYGAMNYAVGTWAGTPGNAGLQDGSAATAKFNSPVGLAQDIVYNGFLVADLKNNVIRRIQNGPPPVQVPAPSIGWVDYTVPPAEIVSVLRTDAPFVFNNDVTIAIAGTAGAETHFTSGLTGSSIPDPDPVTGGTPAFYRDGMLPNEVPPTIVPSQPDVTIKAIGYAPGRPSSAVVSARFQFKTASPVITGNNAAMFNVSDQTVGAEMWYTLDGTEPSPTSTNSLGPITSVASLSLNVGTGLTFRVRAFRANYQDSEIVTTFFSSTNFVPNSISFGFASGEASSDFIAAPGQFFYAPVTLSPVAGTEIYSLQFNLTVTNAGPSPGPAVASGAYSFQSFLEKPIPDTKPVLYERIPPYMFVLNAANPPPPSAITIWDGTPFLNMMFTNTALNLLGVGWLERVGMTNLYDTTKQTLITFSQPHDTLFSPDMGKVVVGGYAFQVPPTAVPGQTYRIQIGRPSATSDGIGAPGSDVYISTPTNGSLAGGAMNSIKIVTTGQRKYLAGDCAPFRWFNAGDFGNTNLNNSDVMQVFQSAIYFLNYPPKGSDFYDSMDSCGGFGGLDPATGYLTNSGPLTLAQQNGLFDGNDSLINQIPFGNLPQTNLDVCDVYVTFRRSLDPSLTWFRRFWTNGVLEAEPIYPQPQAKSANTQLQPKLSASFVTNPPSINFAAADFTASAGQTLQVPITAKIFGSYPLRVLMLSLSVEPLDGSPALTSPVQFTPNAALGSPAMSSSTGNGNYAATWLNSAIAGLTGGANVGTLTVTIPANAPSSAAYAIHFDHASASPNGIASFPKQALTGLILLSDRSASIYGDGIPDSWRLRYFGTVNNILSQAAADADGDGASNWHEYVAGTDPTDPTSLLRVSTGQSLAKSSQDSVIRWPSVAGKQYVIERSASLFGPNWSPVSTITGSGTDMEYHDATGGTVRFYRVHVTP